LYGIILQVFFYLARHLNIRELHGNRPSRQLELAVNSINPARRIFAYANLGNVAARKTQTALFRLNVKRPRAKNNQIIIQLMDLLLEVGAD
jgi:hypothetical protein